MRLDRPKSGDAKGDLAEEMEILGGFDEFYICNKVSYICHIHTSRVNPLLFTAARGWPRPECQVVLRTCRVALRTCRVALQTVDGLDRALLGLELIKIRQGVYRFVSGVPA